jgi:hypothetical protein
LAALAETVSLNDWRKIAERAKTDALDGDAKARDCLSRYLLGVTPPTLTEVSATEGVGIPLELAVRIVTSEFPIKVDPTGFVEFDTERIVS